MKSRIPAINAAVRVATQAHRSRYSIPSCLAVRPFCISTRQRQALHSDEQVRFPGALEAKFTTTLKFDDPKDRGVIPCYRVMNSEGVVVDESYDFDLTDEEALKMYTNMLAISILDPICLDAQRQGRVSFYMVSAGEEGIAVGSASALKPADVAFAQYRELGLFVQRGFTFTDIMSQLFANKHDPSHGRNMPVHYGSRALNIHTISSPLATQLPQAAGAAYALKMKYANGDLQEPACVACYFGEGAASEGDFHAALNIAATRNCPVVYICRNNGYAISTPTLEQYRGDGIASRGAGYGMETIRVDGNDILAVRQVMKHARNIALGLVKGRGEGETKPVLVEAMSYRVSHHSTSDDSFAYRARADVEDWKRRDNPITRFRKFLESKGLWNEEKETEARTRLRKEVLKAFSDAEKEVKPPIGSMFEDVYRVMTPELVAQREELRDLIERYPEEYEVQGFQGGTESLRG